MNATATRTLTVANDLTLERTDGTEADVLTTAELSALFGMTPRRLRRIFRRAGMGCGKGRIYATSPEDVQGVLDLVTAHAQAVA